MKNLGFAILSLLVIYGALPTPLAHGDEARLLSCFSNSGYSGDWITANFQADSNGHVTGYFEYSAWWNGSYPEQRTGSGPIGGTAVQTPQGTNAEFNFLLFGHPAHIKIQNSVGKWGDAICTVHE